MAFDNYANTTNKLGSGLGGVTTTGPTSQTTTGNSTGNTQSTGTTEQSGTSSQTQRTNTTQQNMTPEQLAALDTLIKQLMGGGTQQMAEERARKLQEIQALQQQRAGYSKENAFADAQGAMAQQLRQAMEQLIPGLTRAAEGAGTSQSSMRALLLQDAATKASQAAATVGLGAATNYGQISNGMSGVLANLLAQNDPTTAALLQALGISKGSVSNTQGTSQTDGTTTSTGTTTQNQNTNQTTNQNQNTSGGTTTVTPLNNTMGSFSGSNSMGLSSSAMDYLNNGGYAGLGQSTGGAGAYDLQQLLRNDYTDSFKF